MTTATRSVAADERLRRWCHTDAECEAVKAMLSGRDAARKLAYVRSPLRRRKKRPQPRPAESCDGSGTGRTLVLVRGHKPTMGAIERILQWERNVAADSRACYDIALSLDTTNGTAHLKAVERTLQRRGSRIAVHSYDSGEMRREFPALGEAEARMPPMWRRWVTRGRPGITPSLAWGFHVEAVCLATRRSLAARGFFFPWDPERYRI